MPHQQYHIGFDYPENVSKPLGSPLSPTFQKIRVGLFADGRGLRNLWLYRNRANASGDDYELISGELKKFFSQENSDVPLVKPTAQDNPPWNQLQYYLYMQDDTTQVSPYIPTPVIGGRFLLALLHKVLVLEGMMPAPFFSSKDADAHRERGESDPNFGRKTYEEQLNFPPLEEMYFVVINFLQQLIKIPEILPCPNNKDPRVSYEACYSQLTGYHYYAQLTKEELYEKVLAPLLNKLLELMSSDQTPELANWIRNPLHGRAPSAAPRKEKALTDLTRVLGELTSTVWRQDNEIIAIPNELTHLTQFCQHYQAHNLNETAGSGVSRSPSLSGSDSSLLGATTMSGMVAAATAPPVPSTLRPTMLAEFELRYQDQSLGMCNRQDGALVSTWTLPRTFKDNFLKVTISEADYAKWPYLFPELSLNDNPAVSSSSRSGLKREITFALVNYQKALLPLWMLLLRLTRALCGQYRTAGFKVNDEQRSRLALQYLCEYFRVLLTYTNSIGRMIAREIATPIVLIHKFLNDYCESLPKAEAVQSNFWVALRPFHLCYSESRFIKDNHVIRSNALTDSLQLLQREKAEEARGRSLNVFEDTLLTLKHYQQKYRTATPNSDAQCAYAVNCWMLRWFLVYLIEQPQEPIAKRLATWGKSVIISVGQEKHYTGSTKPLNFGEIISKSGKTLKAWYERVLKYSSTPALNSKSLQQQQPDWRLKYQPQAVISNVPVMPGALLLNSPASAPLGAVLQMVPLAQLPGGNNPYGFLQLENYTCPHCVIQGYDTTASASKEALVPVWCPCERGFQAFLQYSITGRDPRRAASPSGSATSLNPIYASSGPVVATSDESGGAAAGAAPIYDVPPQPGELEFAIVRQLVALLTAYRDNWKLLEPEQATYLANLLAACLMNQGQTFSMAYQQMAAIYDNSVQESTLRSAIVSRIESINKLLLFRVELLLNQPRTTSSKTIPADTVDQLYLSSKKSDATLEDRKLWRTVSLVVTQGTFRFTLQQNALQFLGNYIQTKDYKFKTISTDDDEAVFPSEQQATEALEAEFSPNYGIVNRAAPPGVPSSFAASASSAPPSPVPFGAVAASSTPQRPGPGARGSLKSPTPSGDYLQFPPPPIGGVAGFKSILQSGSQSGSAEYLQCSPPPGLLPPGQPAASTRSLSPSLRRTSDPGFRPMSAPLPEYVQMGRLEQGGPGAQTIGRTSPVYSVANPTNLVLPIVRLIELLSGKYGFFVKNIQNLPPISDSLIQQLLVVSLISPARTWGEIFTEVTQNRLYVFENFSLDSAGLDGIFRAIVHAATANEKFSASSGAASSSEVRVGIVDPQAIFDLKAMFGLDQTQQFTHIFDFIMPDSSTIKAQLAAPNVSLWKKLMEILAPLVAALPRAQQEALTRYYNIRI